MGRSGTTSLWSSGLNGVLECVGHARVSAHGGGTTANSQSRQAVCGGTGLESEFFLIALGFIEERDTTVGTRLDAQRAALACQSYRVKPHEQLVSVSLTGYPASTPDLSTSWSRTTLQGALGPGKTHLETSFPLRCFQRLSLPHLATRRCHWRDNRYTRGASTPVLSY